MAEKAIAGGIVWKDNAGRIRNTWGWNAPSVSWPGVVVFAALSSEQRDRYPVHRNVCGYCPGHSPVLMFDSAEEVMSHVRADVESYSSPSGHPSHLCRVVPPSMVLLEKVPLTVAEIAARYAECQVIPLYEGDLEDVNHGLAFGLSPTGWAKIKAAMEGDLRDVVQDFLRKKISFADLREAVS